MKWHGDVFRFDKDARVVDPTLQPRWMEWVTALGLDPNELLPDAVVRVDRATNQYALHVSKIRRTPDGERWVDEATLEMVSEPVVVLIGQAKVWPEPQRERVAA